MTDEPVMLDVTDSPMAQLAEQFPAAKPVDWVEDELRPYTGADRLRDARWCYLFDTYGRGVANLWLEMGCPEEFQWTEIISGPSDG